MSESTEGSSLPGPDFRSSVPLLIFDGDCSFCRYWVDRWKSVTGDRVRYAPFQEVATDFPQIPLDHFRRSVQLIPPDGQVLSAAHAVFRTLTYAPRRSVRYRLLLWLYREAPGFALACEWFYRLVAAHRDFFFKINRVLWGARFVPASHFLTRWLFLRGLGVVYLIAFLSLWVQISGLMGHHGILPATDLLAAVSQRFGSDRYRLFPTLVWLDSSDAFLQFLAGGGALASLLALLGIAEGPCLVVTWLFYLSLVTAGGDFMEFQWDILLLEVGFLAIFFAPWQLLAPGWRAKNRSAWPPSTAVLWLLRWLLFRLLFMSGAVKLLSGDPTWRNLTALDYHYYTQPLPTPVAWYMAQLPGWFQKSSCLAMFAIELGVPFLIFAPRRLRLAGTTLLVFLQVLIGVTGNYTFFNLLTIVLCFLLLDDAFARRLVPPRLAGRIIPDVAEAPIPTREEPSGAPDFEATVEASHQNPDAQPKTRRWAAAALFIVIFVSSAGHELARLSRGSVAFRPALWMLGWLEPFHIVNGYGLFAVMTTTRLEILVEGSNDGETWLDYEFKYKPGDVKRPPPWVEPHQPRLDWQMWFAALGSYENNPWFVNFMVRLLEGSPQVLALLAKNPFPNAPPRFIRAVVYDYHFTDFATRRATGAWWQREPRGSYFPTVSLKSGDQAREQSPTRQTSLTADRP